MSVRISASWLGIALLFLTGCVDNHESIGVETTAGGRFLAGAECQLDNDSGTWFVTTPGTVSVHRGLEDLTVRCTKDGYIQDSEKIKSSTDYGTIFLNGVVQSTIYGSAWSYPQIIAIPMQSKTVSPAPTVTGLPDAMD